MAVIVHHALLGRTSARELLDVVIEKSGTACSLWSPVHNSRKTKEVSHEVVQIFGSREAYQRLLSVTSVRIRDLRGRTFAAVDGVGSQFHGGHMMNYRKAVLL